VRLISTAIFLAASMASWASRLLTWGSTDKKAPPSRMSGRRVRLRQAIDEALEIALSSMPLPGAESDKLKVAGLDRHRRILRWNLGRSNQLTERRSPPPWGRHERRSGRTGRLIAFGA